MNFLKLMPTEHHAKEVAEVKGTKGDKAVLKLSDPHHLNRESPSIPP